MSAEVKVKGSSKFGKIECSSGSCDNELEQLSVSISSIMYAGKFSVCCWFATSRASLLAFYIQKNKLRNLWLNFFFVGILFKHALTVL